MGMKVKDLFKMSLFKNAKLIAGKNGLDNEIIWFNLMEIIDVVNSLEKGEFLITTGYGFNDDKISKNLISKLKNRGLSGLGIQLGYYIDFIPEHMINEANELGFPIVYIPPKITFSMITRTLYKELTHYQEEEIKYKNATEAGNILLDILENKIINESRMNYIKNLVDSDEKDAYLIIFTVFHKYDGIIMRTDIKDSLEKIINVLRQNKCTVHDEVIRGSNLLLFTKNRDVKFTDIYNSIDYTVTSLSDFYENLNFTAGISSRFSDVEYIQKAYYEAVSAQQQLKKIHCVKGVICFENSDLLDLFIRENTRNELIEFSKNILKPIKNYDKEMSTNYLELLRSYIVNNCNITTASDHLYVHRHTMKNKLEKMNMLFSLDYSDSVTLLKYRLAFLINNLYG